MTRSQYKKMMMADDGNNTNQSLGILKDMPEDVMRIIVECLSLIEVFAYQRVSRKFKYTCDHISSVLPDEWLRLFLRIGLRNSVVTLIKVYAEDIYRTPKN